MTSYTRNPPKGLFSFSHRTYRTADFTEMTDTTVSEDSYNTVAKKDLRKGEAAALGRGQSRNPDEAEGFNYMDVRSSNDADADGNKDKLSGQGRYVVLNANNTVVDILWSGTLDELRTGVADTDRRNRKPFPRQTAAQKGVAEVYGEDYAIGFQVQLDDGAGTDDFSLAASEWKSEGYYGEKMN